MPLCARHTTKVLRIKKQRGARPIPTANSFPPGWDKRPEKPKQRLPHSLPLRSPFCTPKRARTPLPWSKQKRCGYGLIKQKSPHRRKLQARPSAGTHPGSIPKSRQESFHGRKTRQKGFGQGTPGRANHTLRRKSTGHTECRIGTGERRRTRRKGFLHGISSETPKSTERLLR